MHCEYCNIEMEFKYTVGGRGRHVKAVYRCPNCTSYKTKRVKLIGNKNTKRWK